MITHQGRQYTDDGRLRVIHRSAPPGTLLKQGGWAIDSGGRVFIRVMPEIPANYGGRENMFGFKMDPNGCLLVATSGTVAYKHQGFAFRTDGAVFITTNTPVTKHQGLGRDSRGYLCVDGLAAAWNFVDGGLTGLGGTVAFTRGSTATYFGSDGLLKTAAIDAPRFDYDPSTAKQNLLLHTEELSNGVWQIGAGSNVAKNAIAPNGKTIAWTVTEQTAGAISQTVNTATSSSGSFFISGYFKRGNTDWILFQISNFASNSIGMWVDLANKTAGDQRLGGNGNNITKTRVEDVGDGWVKVTVGGNLGSYTVSPRWSCQTAQSGASTNAVVGGTFVMWGPSFSFQEQEYIPTTSSIAGKGATPKGLLIEEARTNLCLQSENFSASNWTKDLSSITENAIIAPDGNTTADALIENTSSGVHIARQVFSLAASTYTYSVFAKAGARSKVQLLTLLGSDFVFTLFDLNSGIFSTGTESLGSLVLNSSSIENKGNGWYRCAISFTSAVSSGSVTIRHDLHNGTTANYPGDGSSGCYLWGAQLEAGAFPSSYIPTTTATVTRSADFATVTNISSFHTGFPCTIISEHSCLSTSASAPGLNRVVWAIDDVTAGNRVQLYVSEPGHNCVIVTSNASNGANFCNILSVADGVVVKNSVGLKENNVYQSANGQAATTDTTVNMPTRVQILEIGQAFAVAHLGGHIRSLSYYNKLLDQGDGVAITT